MNHCTLLAELISDPLRTYAVTIAGTTDSVRIPPAPLDKGGGDSRGDRAIG
jgi:hypothetical protein